MVLIFVILTACVLMAWVFYREMEMSKNFKFMIKEFSEVQKDSAKNFIETMAVSHRQFSDAVKEDMNKFNADGSYKGGMSLAEFNKLTAEEDLDFANGYSEVSVDGGRNSIKIPKEDAERLGL